jgi:futalosine hydrolase
VPTELERRKLEELGGFPHGLALVETCGFGPIAAAARTAALLAELRPARVVLIGIAGSYDPVRHPLGTAAWCRSVAIDGLETHGFEQAPGIGERLEIARPPLPERIAELLLTVSAPSRSTGDAAARRQRFPEAALEDMEGYGAALACALAEVPFMIVRGVSNVAGDGSRERWRIADALAAARAEAIGLLDR